MITAVDSNVLIDIFGDSSKFYETSKRALQHCLAGGKVVCSDVVYAEVAGWFDDFTVLQEAMHVWGIEFQPLSQPAALCAGTTWHNYRRNKGKRDRLIADFLIGAHALTQCNRLLTRDRGFYRKYFGKLSIIDPTHSS